MLELRGGPAERVGPLFDGTRRASGRLSVTVVAAIVAASGVAGCATSGAPVSDGGSVPTPVSTDPPPDLLAQVRDAYEAGDYGYATRGADSLYYLWRTEDNRSAYADSALWLEALSLARAGVEHTAAERLSELLARELSDDLRTEATRARAFLLTDLAREPEAVDLLIANPDVVEGPIWALLRDAAAAMSADELSRVRGITEPENSVQASVAAQYATALVQAGFVDEALQVARVVIEIDAEEADRDLAEAVQTGTVGLNTEPIRVGAILPLTGRFAAVGRFLQNGMRLALEQTESAIEVELVLRDDGSDPRRAVELLRELEADGVAAVIGPIRSQAFAAAIDARVYPGLLLVSPTATEIENASPNAYTLWDRARRTAEVAFEVGRWLAVELDMVQLGALVTDSPIGRDALLAFRAGATHGGALLSGYAPYSPDSTTFAEPIEVVASYAPEAVFISTRDASAALQIGPQLSFYGLRGVVVVGGPSWAEPAVVRRLDPSFANYKLVGTFVDQFATDGAWTDFKRSYEITHRASLRDNMLPALGHDAMLLVLAALPDRGPVRQGAVARAFAGVEWERGASGDLRPDPASSTISRIPLIRMILDRTLVDPEPTAVLAHLVDAAAIEAARARHRQAEAADAVADLERENE